MVLVGHIKGLWFIFYYISISVMRVKLLHINAMYNTTPNDIKQSANLARFKKYLKRFILSSSDNPD